jgi:hypothetical protein
MAEDQDLEVLGAVVTARADHEASQGMDREGEEEQRPNRVFDPHGPGPIRAETLSRLRHPSSLRSSGLSEGAALEPDRAGR